MDVWNQAYGCMCDEIILVEQGGYECEVFTVTGKRWRFAGCDCTTLGCLYEETDLVVEKERDRRKACP